MNYVRFLFLLGSCLIVNILSIQAQGCSDAGACSIESFTPAAAAPTLLNEVSVGVNAGAADHDIFVLGGQLGYTRRFGSFSVDTKLTYTAQSGNDISESGLGDVFVIANYKPSLSFTVSAGVKVPTNKADKSLYNKDLPMDYQSSLGTLDLILGVSFQKNNWLLALGYQQPLQQNENQYNPWGWYDPLWDFEYTVGFERKSDVLLRISRILKLTDKLTVAPGLLPIYHLDEDEVDAQGTSFPIEGSSGLTLNATAHFLLQVSAKNKLGFNIGFPLVVRETRPDGLTRSFVVGVEYVIPG